MRYYFYHTDLGQNAAFHNFAIQIALIQIIQDDRSTLGLPKSHIGQPVLTFAVRAVASV